MTKADVISLLESLASSAHCIQDYYVAGGSETFGAAADLAHAVARALSEGVLDDDAIPLLIAHVVDDLISSSGLAHVVGCEVATTPASGDA